MEVLDSLLDTNKYTKLGICNKNGKLRASECDKDKEELAFVCQAGQFAPLKIPFGPTGAIR